MSSEAITKNDLTNILNEIAVSPAGNLVGENVNGDISITRNITAGGDIETSGDIEAAGDVIASGIPISQLHDWCLMYASSKTITNTEAQITGVTLWSGGTGSYFDTSTADQVKIKKAGRFLVIVNFRLSAVTNADNVKRLGTWKNGASNQMAMGRLSSWEDSTSFDVKNYAVNDILKMYAKTEDNNSTLYIGSIFIMPIA